MNGAVKVTYFLILQLQRINNIIRTEPRRISTPTHTNSQRIRPLFKRTRRHIPRVNFTVPTIRTSRHASRINKFLSRRICQRNEA